MQRVIKRLSALLAVAVLGGVNPAFTDAGFFGWMQHSFFGHGHHHHHRAPVMAPPLMGPPMGVPMGHAPVGSVHAAGFAPVCPCPVPNPCPPCPVANPCPPCPGGDCGVVGYPPPPHDDRQPYVEPTEVEPDVTPRTFNGRYPEDDFRPALPREDDFPRSNPPRPQAPGEEYNDVFPEEFRPPAPGDPSETANPSQPGPSQSEPSQPGPSRPGPSRPQDDQDDEDVLPGLPPGVQAEPLELEPTPVANVRPERRRVLISAGYRIPSVARVRLIPKEPSEEEANVARN